jgi:hypothetical protein
MNRTDTRTQFHNDIITTAVEGGIGYWSQTSYYQWEDDGVLTVAVGTLSQDSADRNLREYPHTCAVVHVLKDDESGYEEDGRVIDVDLIAKAYGVLRALKADRTSFNGHPALSTPDGEDAHLSVRYRDHLLKAYREEDAGEIDSDDADNLVQLGLFGKVVYG